MAIATGPTVRESTNVRHVTDSMPEPHVPGPPSPNKATRVNSTKESQKLPPDTANTNKGQSVG